MPIALEKLTRAEAVKLALLGFGLGLLPHALGLLLGFAAFVVTPVVGGLAAGACGFAAARMEGSAATRRVQGAWSRMRM